MAGRQRHAPGATAHGVDCLGPGPETSDRPLAPRLGVSGSFPPTGSCVTITAKELRVDIRSVSVADWHQVPNNAQCPSCKQYKWYTDGNENWKCTGCGFSYGPKS